MRTSKTAPQWAIDLVEQVCSDYTRKLPVSFVWFRYQDDYEWSRGRTKYNGSKIFMRVGTNVEYQKLVLLHELAHHVICKTFKGRREGHSARFWRVAFELYERYGVDLDFAWEHEKNYKKKAEIGYQAVLAKR